MLFRARNQCISGVNVQFERITQFCGDDGARKPVNIFKLIDRKEPEPVPFEDVKEKLAEDYVGEHRDGKINELLEELKGKAEIEEIEPEPEMA